MISGQEKENGDENEDKKECAYQRQIWVLDELAERFPKGPVEIECESKSHSQDAEGKELVYEPFHISANTEDENEKNDDNINEIHKKEVSRRFFRSNVL